MTEFDLPCYLAERRAAVDRALEGALPAEDVAPATVHRAMGCLDASDMKALHALPRGNVLAPLDISPAILLLTPLAFLLSTARNCREISDILALVLGIALFPLVSQLHTGVDILISGVTAGSIAYGVHWWRERARA